MLFKNEKKPQQNGPLLFHLLIVSLFFFFFNLCFLVMLSRGILDLPACQAITKTLV